MRGDDAPTPVLVHSSGRRRGEAVTLSGDEIRIGTDPTMDLRLPSDTDPPPAPHHVTLVRRGAS